MHMPNFVGWVLFGTATVAWALAFLLVFVVDR